MSIGFESDRERVAVWTAAAVAVVFALASPWVHTNRPLHPGAVALLALALLPWLVASTGVRLPMGSAGGAAVLVPLTVLHLAGDPLGAIDARHDLQLTFMIVSQVVGFAVITASPRIAAALAVWGVALPVGRLLVEPEFDPWPFWFMAVLTGVVLGLVGRRQLRLVQRLEEAQTALARQAALEERRRVAREVHDVVAHSLTVTMLHLGAARLALGPGNEVAAEALDEAERCGRQSLDDIRRTVGLLRAGDEPATEHALPHASELDGLVARWTEAGLAVTLTVDGNAASLGPTQGLVVYRVVQEALSNVAKHAPGARARVQVVHGEQQVDVRVDDDGAGTPPRPGPPGHGLGLTGMRERVELLDGRLRAGPHGAGWRVEATIPLGAPEHPVDAPTAEPVE